MILSRTKSPESGSIRIKKHIAVYETVKLYTDETVTILFGSYYTLEQFSVLLWPNSWMVEKTALTYEELIPFKEALEKKADNSQFKIDKRVWTLPKDNL